MRVYVDTSALIALAWPKDANHAKAKVIAAALDGRVIVLSSVAVLCEYHRLRLYRDGVERARTTATALLADPVHRWLPVTPELITAAMQKWIARFPDQQFSLTDAVSFEIMKREKLSHAFAFDRHFATAGFQLL